MRIVLSGWLIVVCLFAVAWPARSAEPPPNVVLIVTDDQGWWDLSSHGNPALETPSLDRLAREGVELTRFYVQPVCAPTRAGLMTGRYYLRTGLYNTRFGGDTLGPSETTLAQLLGSAGYRTGIFGKWHLGVYARYRPHNRGFDESLCELHGHIERYDYPDQLWQNGEPVEARGHVTDLFTDAAIGFIEAHQDRPFFCYLPYNVPHSPHYVGEAHGENAEGDALLSKYMQRGVPINPARIYSQIERCDRNIGRLLDKLDDLDLTRRTVVVFMSDNGGIHDHYRAGLRGKKASVYEGGVLSPCLIRWPGTLPEGKKSDAMASHVDLLPTFCQWAGVRLPADLQLDGHNLAPLLTGQQSASPHTYCYAIWDRYTPSLKSRWSVCDRQYKLVHNAAGQPLELFDLRADRGERTNLADQRPDDVRRLQAEFQRWFDEVTAGQVYEPSAIEVGRADDNPIELQGSWALTEGSRTEYVFRGYDWDTIQGWSDPADSARWQLDVVRAGRYEVTISYGAERASAGARYRLSIGSATLEGTVEATIDPNVFIRRPAGELTIAETGRCNLTVEPVETRGNELMRLNRVWLRRLDP